MSARRYDYAQTVIGECGHACAVWPLFHPIGGKGDYVVCEECTREKYGIDQAEQILAYVRIEEPKKPATPKTTTQRAKRVKCSMCSRPGHTYLDCPLLGGQESLLSG